MKIGKSEVEAFFGLEFSESGILKKILVSIESFFMRRFDHVSTISNSMLERIHKLGVSPNNTSLFPNWVNVELFSFEKNENDLRRKWDIKNDKKIVLLMLFYMNLRLMQKTL
ncbi:hypothetical protein [Desulfobacterium sp. N47]|uniref:Uncharacterized protein n=1 Tax=uncultured Desulfobacterium sp. TaxID=201089 RepID=E1YHB8_9BACT|nr:unknown protein [uncultured Desulfobacterium sp.]